METTDFVKLTGFMNAGKKDDIQSLFKERITRLDIPFVSLAKGKMCLKRDIKPCLTQPRLRPRGYRSSFLPKMKNEILPNSLKCFFPHLPKAKVLPCSLKIISWPFPPALPNPGYRVSNIQKQGNFKFEIPRQYNFLNVIYPAILMHLRM